MFVQLLNDQYNVGSHITKLLESLQALGSRPIVDDRGLIFGEYVIQIGAAINSGDDTRNEMQILRYWIHHPAPRIVVVSGRDRLMSGIKRVIVERSESVDRAFVYVSFRSGKTLITNDNTHIVNGPPRERSLSPRRVRLLRSTRRARCRGSEILTSEEAYAKVGSP